MEDLQKELIAARQLLETKIIIKSKHHAFAISPLLTACCITCLVALQSLSKIHLPEPEGKKPK